MAKRLYVISGSVLHCLLPLLPNLDTSTFLIWQYIAVLQGATKHPCSLLYRLPFACLLFLLGLPTIAAAATDTAPTVLHPLPHRPAANCGCKGGARGGGAMRAHARCMLAACTSHGAAHLWVATHKRVELALARLLRQVDGALREGGIPV